MCAIGVDNDKGKSWIGWNYTNLSERIIIYAFFIKKKRVKYHNLHSRKPKNRTCVTFGTPLGLLFTNEFIELKRTWYGASVVGFVLVFICYWVHVFMLLFTNKDDSCNWLTICTQFFKHHLCNHQTLHIFHNFFFLVIYFTIFYFF